jgi:hypothetical protein
MELARSEYIERRENIIAIGNSGTGKSHNDDMVALIVLRQVVDQLRPRSFGHD